MINYEKRLNQIDHDIDRVLTRLYRMEIKIDRIVRLICDLQNTEKNMTHTLEETLAEVTSEGSRLDSVETLIEGIKKQLADALANSVLSPEAQAKVDQIFSGLQANSSKIDKALNSNVPPPEPAPQPA